MTKAGKPRDGQSGFDEPTGARDKRHELKYFGLKYSLAAADGIARVSGELRDVKAGDRGPGLAR